MKSMAFRVAGVLVTGRGLKEETVDGAGEREVFLQAFCGDSKR